jgi:glycosyltransferase involved in cell wall biosynthesis
MTKGARVLYLGPRSTHPHQLARYSFLDEEIRALADAGIEAFVLGQTGGRDQDLGRVHVRGVPPDTPLRRWRVGRFAAGQLRRIPVRNLPAVRRCYRAARIECVAAEIVGREKIDLIHSYFGYPSGFGGFLSQPATGTPLVAHLRGNDVNTDRTLAYGSRLDPNFDRAIRRLLQRADRTIFVSEFLRRRAAALGANLDTSRVIRQGVRGDLFRPSANKAERRRVLGLGSAPLILAVAGLTPIKGVLEILRAVALLRGQHDFSLVVCGDGPQRGVLEQASIDLGIAAQTRFVGRVPRAEIPWYFEAADLFAHGSLIESAGYVLLEAMAAGLPVVCTDAGGPAEYVADGVAGFVVPVAHPSAMAEKILLLLRDAALRDRLGRSGRARVETHFRFERMIQETLDTYRELTPTLPWWRSGAVSDRAAS